MSTLAFFVNQLEDLDRTINEPLYNVSWGRDINIRKVSSATESTSFTRINYGAIGTTDATGLPWASSNSTAIPGISVNSEKITKPLRELRRELAYSNRDLEMSMSTGQSIDQQLYQGLTMDYQMSVDRMVYVGDTTVGATGLVNQASGVGISSLSSAGTWDNKTPDQILADINKLLQETWSQSGESLCPDKLLLAGDKFSTLVSKKVSDAGNVSILTFLEENSLSSKYNGRKLNIQPVKWLSNAGVGGTSRMVAYTNDQKRVRFPMAPISRSSIIQTGFGLVANYFWLLGELEIVYPESIRYADGI
jgi:hypothetical protein